VRSVSWLESPFSQVSVIVRMSRLCFKNSSLIASDLFLMLRMLIVQVFNSLELGLLDICSIILGLTPLLAEGVIII
jgi:hypothetical protein